MSLSYKPLWDMLNELKVSKMDFAKSVGISNGTLAKLGKDEPVALTVLMRICEHYNCKIEDVIMYNKNSDFQFDEKFSLNDKQEINEDNVDYMRGVQDGIQMMMDKIQRQHKNGKPVTANGELYWLTDSRQHLQDVMDSIGKDE
jgi:DNA-binding Xre family transcriptional regulator